MLLAEWRHFSMLLTGDAEAEAVPLEPGPVDVLKVAHHGSEDEGLARLLETHGPEARGDLGRREPLRAPDRRDARRHWARPACRVARTDDAARSRIEADAAGW